MQNKQTASWSELLWGRNGLRSVALAGGVALHAVNVYIVTTILPSVVQDIGGLEYYAWNTTLFVVASILGSALSPKAMDSFGARRAFLMAIVIFVLGTVGCALAPSMPWMLAGRTAQGLGGGLLLGLSYSSVRLVFEERLWPLAMVFVSSMWGVATLAGPAIGGIFAQTGHWRLAFWVVLPIAAGLSWLVHTQVAPVAGLGDKQVKAPLGKISVLALSVLVVSVASLSDSWYWNLLGIAVGLFMTVLVAKADNRSEARLFPTGSYSIHTALGSLYACICLLSIGVTTEIYIPYFLQLIHGKTPLIAGYLTALMSAGWTLGSFISSNRSPATSNRLIQAGPIISAGSLLMLGVMMPLTSLSQDAGSFSWLIVPLVGVGLGVGLCWPNLLTRVFKSAPAGQENIASSAITTLQLYAMAMGASLAGMVTNAAGFMQPGGALGAQQAAIALFTIFAVAPALAAIFSRGARRAAHA
ncbi:MFS transporter [Candidimonas sp. SYP-B2681]|uniref:MFS transporter n=1 Tax=Candidimonas sp. SYP-B2681 TaxID=2497686 RepID=UPI000F8802FC|nr:MFS transporter [Candidimonas sp. SYP-B2681]RTZ45599.1 MFS transporter [Candidimonas sp. SYP-B2681]